MAQSCFNERIDLNFSLVWD